MDHYHEFWAVTRGEITSLQRELIVKEMGKIIGEKNFIRVIPE